MSRVPPLDLSKATKLKNLSFRCRGQSIQWIAMALPSVTSKNLQQIITHCNTTCANPIGETVHREWRDLDRLFIQFWISHSIRPKIEYEATEGENNLRALAPSLLPELMWRRAVDLVGHDREECAYLPCFCLVFFGVRNPN
jgi:hypothetical protein